MTKGKKPGDKADYITPEEMNRLLTVVSGDLYYSTLYNFLRYSGRRIGEVYGTYRNKQLTAGIQIKNISEDFETIKTTILKTKKRKLQISCSNCKKETSYKNKFCPICGKELPKIDESKLKYTIPKEIDMPMRPELKIILSTYIKQNKLKQNDYLFREKSLVYLKKKIKIHARLAGINKNVSLHTFRRYFITQCKLKGMKNEDIKLWTGHVDSNTLNLYDSRVPDDIRKNIMEVQL